MAKGGIKFIAGSPIFALLGLIQDAVAPTQAELSGVPTCSFCDRPLDPTTTTLGRGPLRRSIETEPILDPMSGKVVGFEEILRFNSTRLAACPGCSLRLADKVVRDEKGGVKLNRAGEPYTTGVRTVFPDFD